jgi:hypothetical protein
MQRRGCFVVMKGVLVTGLGTWVVSVLLAKIVYTGFHNKVPIVDVMSLYYSKIRFDVFGAITLKN